MKRMIYALIAAVCTVAASAPVHSQDNEPIANYEVLFSPEDQVDDKLISLISAEKKSVRAAVYCLMHRGIAKALIDAHKRGVKVEVIVDPYSIKSRSPVNKMGAEELSVFVWNPPEHIKESRNGKKVKQKKPLMHDKFCVLGDSTVWTGSFNFTFEGANRNRENVVVLENAQVAAKYLAEFERLKKTGCISLSDYLVRKN